MFGKMFHNTPPSRPSSPYGFANLHGHFEILTIYSSVFHFCLSTHTTTPGLVTTWKAPHSWILEVNLQYRRNFRHSHGKGHTIGGGLTFVVERNGFSR